MRGHWILFGSLEIIGFINCTVFVDNFGKISRFLHKLFRSIFGLSLRMNECDIMSDILLDKCVIYCNR